jgi:rhamnose transport system substrate-binding protein
MKRLSSAVFRVAAALLIATITVCGAASISQAQDQIRIAFLVKNLGNRFFDAVRDGGTEAAKELGNVEIIYVGPTSATAEGQIEIINSLMAQRVNAIAISANDTNALIPATKRAMDRGIKVVSFDSAIAPEGRIIQVDPSETKLIGAKQVQMMADAMGGEGEFAILSAASTMTNQNNWIAAMKEELKDPKYAKMKLVATAYGDDQSDKSYRETFGLFKSYPNLKGIISPTSIGIVAAAKAVMDQNLVGKVHVTGLGLPSEMKAAVDAGATKSFAIWNPLDLGYTTTQVAYNLIKGTAKGVPGEEIAAGRMGKVKVGPNGVIVMAEPFTFDKSNVGEYAKVF